MNRIKSLLSLATWITVCGLGPLASAQSTPQHFLYKDGKVWVLQESGLVPLPQNIELPNHVIVGTNGTFEVASHPPRSFIEGQILGSDGMILSPNGQIEPVLDHVALVLGGTVASVNGEKSVLNDNVQLGADKWLTPDRVLLGGEHGWMRVIDGQVFSTDGKPIPAVDTITMQQGQVIVQKENTRIALGPGRSIMMNDGTKVFGDGNILNADGQATRVSEGETITVQGVVKLR